MLSACQYAVLLDSIAKYSLSHFTFVLLKPSLNVCTHILFAVSNELKGVPIGFFKACVKADFELWCGPNHQTETY